MRAVKKEFGLSTEEIDVVLERLWPTDLQARLRMIKTDLGKLDRLTQVFFEKAIAGDVQAGTLTVKIWERKHELLGMNAAAKIELIQAPAQAETRYEKITRVITAIARRNAGKGSAGNGGSDGSDGNGGNGGDGGELRTTAPPQGDGAEPNRGG